MRPWTKYRNHPAAVAAHLDDPKYKCCGCCHVQTGTICLGIYNLVTQILAISVLTFAILHPEILLDSNGGMQPIDQEIRFLPQDGIDHINPLDSNVNSNVNVNGAIIDELPTPLPQKETDNAAMEQIDQPGFNGDRPRRYFYTKADMMMFTKKTGPIRGRSLGARVGFRTFINYAAVSLRGGEGTAGVFTPIFLFPSV